MFSKNFFISRLWSLCTAILVVQSTSMPNIFIWCPRSRTLKDVFKQSQNSSIGASDSHFTIESWTWHTMLMPSLMNTHGAVFYCFSLTFRNAGKETYSISPRHLSNSGAYSLASLLSKLVPFHRINTLEVQCLRFCLVWSLRRSFWTRHVVPSIPFVRLDKTISSLWWSVPLGKCIHIMIRLFVPTGY